jgi:hypothetical protein
MARPKLKQSKIGLIMDKKRFFKDIGQGRKREVAGLAEKSW